MLYCVQSNGIHLKNPYMLNEGHMRSIAFNMVAMKSSCTKLCCCLGLVALLFLNPCTAAQLRPDDKNPCIAHFNASVYDISQVFDYP